MLRESERFDNVVSLLQDVTPSSDLSVLTVASVKKDVYQLIGPQFVTEAQLSASCLLLPEVGDTVLAYLGKTSATRFILSVLIKHEASTGTIQLPGNNMIHTMSDKMNLKSSVLTLNATEQLSFQAPSLSMDAHDLHLTSQKISVLASVMNFSAKTITSYVKDWFSTAEQLYLRAKSCFRFIDDFDDTHAGHQRVEVKGRYLHKSESVNMSARGFVKIDGSKIDLG